VPHLGQFLGRQVLLVEDNEINTVVAKSILEKLGCQVVCASDGRESVEFCRAHSPDLVLMDMQMPRMDGLTATRKIREFESKHSPARHTPIIALTANVMNADRDLCLTAGMDDFLAKPFRYEELAAKLARWLPSQVIATAADDSPAALCLPFTASRS
jgi:CheY-like chemotaxis protein